MTMRLRAATTVLALGLAGAFAGAASAASDPLKLPGTPARPLVDKSATGTAGTAPVVPVVAGTPAAAPTTAAPLSEAQKYCQNVAAAAADARFAWQSKKLAEVEAQIKQRVADLDARQTEVKDILGRYNDALKRAKGGLVDIYAKMRPETAAAQISVMDDMAAAAILAQLNPQKASAILNEIAPDRAVKLVTTMSSLGANADGKKS